MPDDLARRSADIKGAAYFLDASQVGICPMPENGWLAGGDHPAHGFAVVILVERTRLPEPDNLAREWIAPARVEIADMRAAEIAVCVAGHIRAMGFAARAHFAGMSLVDMERLAVLAGLAVRTDDGLRNPYLDDFSLAVVTTDYELETDTPLHENALNARGFAYWLGLNGAQSGRERNRQRKRKSHLSRFPMETVKRVERPTTLILDDEVPQVPKRAAFFQRALHGDLGGKAKAERTRFAFKTPLSWSLLQVIRSLVPFQGGTPKPATDRARYRNPQANADAIKSLSYALGADLTGICEIPRYAWFSHKEDGKEIEPYHRTAVVMLIDQGFDTMEGASGDDWISGSQSMRGYLRGAVVAGIMAELLRELGFPARSQTNADSDVLHIPLILWAGLGELQPHRRAGAQPVRRPALQVGGADHRHAARSRPADRFRPADLLLELPEMRARMPLRRHSVRRQGHVQRLRDLEAGRRALHALSPHQRARLGLRALHEDLPHQQGGGRRRRGADTRGELARRQRDVPEALDGAGRHLARRQARQWQAQSWSRNGGSTTRSSTTWW